MGRARLIVVLLGVGVALFCFPSGALAGTYTWNLSLDFTATGSGANPDKDNYAGHPWRYEEGGGTELPAFDTGIDGGLAGWHDAGNLPFVAINPTASSIHGATATYPAGQVALQPTATQPAVVTWTSPLSGTVNVSGTTTADQAGTALVCPNANWTVLRDNVTVDAGTAGTGFLKSIAVSPGDRISLEASFPGGLLATCLATSVTFTVSQTVGAPNVTLRSPADGALISGGQPTFSGTAASGFGAKPVKIHVLQGPVGQRH